VNPVDESLFNILFRREIAGRNYIADVENFR